MAHITASRGSGLRWFQLLQFRLAALGMCAVLGAVLATSWTLLSRAEQDTLAAHRLQDIDEAERLASVLNGRVKAHLRTLGVLAGGIAAADAANADVLEAMLRQRPVALAEFDSVFVADRAGRMVLLHDDRGWRRPDLNVADRAYFMQAMDTGEPVVSEAVIGRYSAEPEAVLAWPLRAGGQVVGIVAGGIKLRSHGMLDDLRPAGTVRSAVTIVVTDSAGHLVSHPDIALIGGPSRAEPRLAAPLKAWAANGGQATGDGFSFESGDELGAGAGISRTGWMVWRFQPLATVLAPLQAARVEGLQVSAAIVAVSAFTLLAVLWWQFAPLRQLKARSWHLFDAAVKVDEGWPTARGEIGELTDVLKQVGSAQRRLSAEHHRMLLQLQSVMAAAPMGILLTRDRRFELASPEACRLLGRSEAELVGQPSQVIYASNEDYLLLGPKVVAAFAKKDVFVGELEFLRGDGARFWGRLSGQPVAWDDAAAGTIWTLNDVTDQRQARLELEWQATHEPLTGLANRKALLYAIERVLSRRAAGQPAALLVMDLDRFKCVNDSHGHAAGDAVLRAVAQAIASCIREGDLLARLGGDEFAVVLDHCAGDVAGRVAEDIRRSVVNMAVRWQDQNLSVGVSVGVAELTGELADATAWLAAADAACYEAKAAGRDAVRCANRAPLRQVNVTRIGVA